MAEDAQAAKTEFQNKLEEQAAAKGGLSYSYFAAGSSAAAPPAPPPKPLSPRSAEVVAANAKPGGGSAWNAAGTYEERDVSAWAHRRCEALLEGLKSPCGVVEVASAAAKGEAHVVFVRGKRRAAFELDISLGWRSAADPEGIRGTAKATNVTGDDVDDEDDVQMVVTLDAAIGGSGVKDGGDPAAAQRAQKAAREGLRTLLCERLRQLRQELRDGQAT